MDLTEEELTNLQETLAEPASAPLVSDQEIQANETVQTHKKSAVWRSVKHRFY
ncbi:MAG TPA: hypothetical protein VN893_09770 [Bryobacteraceae bacterium]|nr:hypothetical protein [Bryobacteraceae bacterium]